jgi:hypothetical protein
LKCYSWCPKVHVERLRETTRNVSCSKRFPDFHLNRTVPKYYESDTLQQFSLRCFHRAFFLNYSLKSTNNNAQDFILCDPKFLRRPSLLLRVSVAFIPPSSGRQILYLTSGVTASTFEICLREDDGIHATETCRRKGGPLRNLGSHRVKTYALLLVLLSEHYSNVASVRGAVNFSFPSPLFFT